MFTFLFIRFLNLDCFVFFFSIQYSERKNYLIDFSFKTVKTQNDFNFDHLKTILNFLSGVKK
jgi:hypothetical protein